MSNSTMITITNKSPNYNAPRNHSIDRITPHCVVGQLSANDICDIFKPSARQASCNYAIGHDGTIALCVDEANRSWCSSSRDNDHRAITIEIASEKYAPYAMNSAAFNSFVDLCVDICKRNGKTALVWVADKNKALAYQPKSHEMLLTIHQWFAATDCPGEWLKHRLPDVAAEVTKRLNPTPVKAETYYRVIVGSYKVRANADTALKYAKANGFKDAFIVATEVSS